MEVTICWISFNLLFSAYNRKTMIGWGFLYNKSNTTTITMLSQIIQFGIIAACRQSTSYFISLNMAVDFFSKSNDLLVCK